MYQMDGQTPPEFNPAPMPSAEAPKKPSKVLSLIAAIIFPILLYVAQYAVLFGTSIVFGFNAAAQQLEGKDAEAYLENMIYNHTNTVMIIADLIIIAILVIWFACRKQSIPKALEMKKVKISRIGMAIVGGIGLSFALGYLMNIAYALFPSTMEAYEEHMSYGGSNLSYILAGVVLAPIVEELLFRALSVKYLDRVLPRALAIFLVAGLFGAMHMDIVQGLYAGTLGALLGCLFFAYDSVWVPMALHFGFNLVSVLSLIDTESMSEAQLVIFGLFLMVFELLAIFGGGVALVFLFLQRTHPVFAKHFKGQKAAFAASPAPAAHEPKNEVLYNDVRPHDGGQE